MCVSVCVHVHLCCGHTIIGNEAEASVHNSQVSNPCESYIGVFLIKMTHRLALTIAECCN